MSNGTNKTTSSGGTFWTKLVWTGVGFLVGHVVGKKSEEIFGKGTTTSKVATAATTIIITDGMRRGVNAASKGLNNNNNIELTKKV